MKCRKCMKNPAIIKITYYSIISDKILCLDCLIDFLDNIKENNDLTHLITKAKKIMPIYN